MTCVLKRANKCSPSYQQVERQRQSNASNPMFAVSQFERIRATWEIERIENIMLRYLKALRCPETIIKTKKVQQRD